MAVENPTKEFFETILATAEVIFDKASKTVGDASKAAANSVEFEIKIKKLEHQKKDAFTKLGESIYESFTNGKKGDDLIDYDKLRHIEYIDSEIAKVVEARKEAQKGAGESESKDS